MPRATRHHRPAPDWIDSLTIAVLALAILLLLGATGSAILDILLATSG